MASLAGKGLVQSAPVSGDGDAGQPEDDRAEACPVISPAGLAALGITVDGEVDAVVEASAPSNHLALGSDLETGAGSDPAPELAPADPAIPEPFGHDLVSHSPQQPRAGSKQAAVLELLARPEGATLDALMAGTGWLPHTTRAVLSGLRKRGHAIERLPGGEGGSSRYRLAAPALVPAAPAPITSASATSAPAA
ncbi:MAG: hypothetical protein CFE31_17440 [Rhizobiales bacterium PAR1]|nr:MAG: hypothetical protein CFE31_17440 [Rhizobiales bacterium PAR1]